ncbi:MAG TPA: dienelactone hydrolase family protein [Candidatus Dormibacteraeota bacterium]|nr:dienelactone hydrolase family protein [Candidatus Dormibacteraeota bacterium]
MTGPHEGQPLLSAGPEPDQAWAAMVMLHGRGATAQDILTLVPELEQPGWTFLAPQAAGATWYPYPFTAPIERNEPWLSSALAVVGEALVRIAAAGIPPERTVLLGFSQGACLTLEFAARNARRFGGVVGLSGGLIGPDGAERHDSGSFEGTPAFLGCSDRDPHIPAGRVSHAAGVLEGMGAEVTMVLYPNLDHTVNREEIEQVRGIMSRLGSFSAQPG